MATTTITYFLRCNLTGENFAAYPSPSAPTFEVIQQRVTGGSNGSIIESIIAKNKTLDEAQRILRDVIARHGSPVAGATAGDSDDGSMKRRVGELERRVGDLEGRRTVPIHPINPAVVPPPFRLTHIPC